MMERERETAIKDICVYVYRKKTFCVYRHSFSFVFVFFVVFLLFSVNQVLYMIYEK